MAIKRQTRRNINQMLGKIPRTLNCAVLIRTENSFNFDFGLCSVIGNKLTRKIQKWSSKELKLWKPTKLFIIPAINHKFRQV